MFMVHTFSVDGDVGPGNRGEEDPERGGDLSHRDRVTMNCWLTRTLLGSIVSVTRCRIVQAAAITTVVDEDDTDRTDLRLCRRRTNHVRLPGPETHWARWPVRHRARRPRAGRRRCRGPAYGSERRSRPRSSSRRCCLDLDGRAHGVDADQCDASAAAPCFPSSMRDTALRRP